MSIQQMKKELQSLKNELFPESRSIAVLLQTKSENMTASEINKVLENTPLNLVPSDIILTYLNREYGTSYTMDNLPEEMPIEWRELEECPCSS